MNQATSMFGDRAGRNMVDSVKVPSLMGDFA